MEFTRKEIIWSTSTPPNLILKSLIELAFIISSRDCSCFKNKHIVTYILTCSKVSYASYFGQHKHAHPIFLVYSVCKNCVILCLNYSFRQINFFCLAHLGHRGLGKVCILKTEGKKSEKNKKNNQSYSTYINTISTKSQSVVYWLANKFHFYNKY